jgi:hypothetical protein
VHPASFGQRRPCAPHGRKACATSFRRWVWKSSSTTARNAPA